jgi:hypothetical protein
MAAERSPSGPTAPALSFLLPPSHALFIFAVILYLAVSLSLSRPPSLSPSLSLSLSLSLSPSISVRASITVPSAWCQQVTRPKTPGHVRLRALPRRPVPPPLATQPRPRSPPPSPARPPARPALRLVTRPRAAPSITHVITRPGPHRSAPRVQQRCWSRDHLPGATVASIQIT